MEDYNTVPAKGTITKFHDQMRDDFNHFFGELINHITELIDFQDRGKAGTDFFKQAAKLSDVNFVKCCLKQMIMNQKQHVERLQTEKG